jgi:hypothetical protein
MLNWVKHFLEELIVQLFKTQYLKGTILSMFKSVTN